MSVEVNHVVEGSPHGPAVLLAGSLGSTLAMWRPQITALAAEGFRVVAYDLRGHGRSPAPPGPYSVADLGDDARALLDRLGVARAHVVGLSIGGMTGMWLAAHAPERVATLALLCTSAWYGQPRNWEERAATVRSGGTGAIVDATIGRWFTPGFIGREPSEVEQMREMIGGNSAEGYASCCAALGLADLRPDLPRITAPTLVIAGADDPAAPPEHAERIANGVPGARLCVLDDAAHLASWERAGAVNELLLEHLHGDPPQ